MTGIQPVDITTEVKTNFINYAMNVIVDRALPDVRDGMKPVQRRIMYAMLQEGLLSNHKHAKSAAVVGEVMKKYHPHGDTSIYDAMVRLGQWWNMRYTLVDPQGNFGSMDGDQAAAMRYTEARMTKLAEEVLADLEKETVISKPNYDETTEEPSVLPAAFPNLLVNGASGIAVGMATNIPPHNLTEIINGLLAITEKPGDTAQEKVGTDDARRDDEARDRPGFSHRGPPLAKRHPRGVPDRPRGPQGARQGPHRGKERAQPDHHFRDSLSGEQDQPDSDHLGDVQGRQDSRHLGPARRIRPQGPGANRRGTQARRDAHAGAQPALQVHPAPDHLHGHEPEHRGRPAARAAADRHHDVLPRAPRRRGDAPHRVRTQAGQGPRPRPGRAAQGARPHRRGHRPDPPQQHRGRGQRRPDAEIRFQRDSGPGDSGYAPATPDRAGKWPPASRVQRIAGPDYPPEQHPGRQDAAVARDSQGTARAAREVR